MRWLWKVPTLQFKNKNDVKVTPAELLKIFCNYSPYFAVIPAKAGIQGGMRNFGMIHGCYL